MEEALREKCTNWRVEGWNKTHCEASMRMSRDGKTERDEEKIEIRLSESRGSYLFSPNSSPMYREPRCSVLSNDAFFKMALTSKPVSNDKNQACLKGPSAVYLTSKKKRQGAIYISSSHWL